MKTTKSIITVLFVLLTAQIASAYYCPSTGRWLSRDPAGEPGFENLLAAGVVPKIGQVASLPPGRWINRDSSAANNDQNRYVFVANNPFIYLDPLGLATVNNSGNLPQNVVDSITAEINSACGHGFWKYVNRSADCTKWHCIGDECQGANIDLDSGTPKDRAGVAPLLGEAGNSLFGLGKCKVTLYPNNGNADTDWGGIALHEFAHCCGFSHLTMGGLMNPPWDGSGGGY